MRMHRWRLASLSALAHDPVRMPASRDARRRWLRPAIRARPSRDHVGRRLAESRDDDEAMAALHRSWVLPARWRDAGRLGFVHWPTLRLRLRLDRRGSIVQPLLSPRRAGGRCHMFEELLDRTRGESSPRNARGYEHSGGAP